MKEKITKNKIGFIGFLLLLLGVCFPTYEFCSILLDAAPSFDGEWILFSASLLLITIGLILAVIGLFKPNRLFALLGLLGVPTLVFLCFFICFSITAHRLGVSPKELWNAIESYELNQGLDSQQGIEFINNQEENCSTTE